MVMLIRSIIFSPMGFKQFDDLLVWMGKGPDVAADSKFGILRAAVKPRGLFLGTEGPLI
jgi:hypothetical protein